MVRKMSGGAQAHLIAASDLKYYVVKFINNPQHRRVLVNELLSSLLLSHLSLPTPPVALVALDAEFIHENSDAYIQGKHQRLSPSVGLQFGSSYPGSPLKDVVYDFLPDVILARVVNLEAFVGMLVFDKWVGNADSRQCIFLRSETGCTDHATSKELQFRLQFIDNGGAFDGQRWRFVDSREGGLYFRPAVYSSVHGWADLESGIEEIRSLSEKAITSGFDQLPSEWFDEDESELHRLMDHLLERRAKTAELLADTIRNCPASFPRWRT
jgi:hypothetical protein